MKKYTIEQIDWILLENEWHSCIANNQKNNKYKFGTDTIFVAQEEEGEYFGEFVGDRELNQYTFKFYV